MKHSLLLLTALALATPALAQEGTLVYTVRPQDTLIGLGRTLLVNPAAWREVARLNGLPDPDYIVAGQTLKMPLRLLRSADAPARIVSVAGQVLLEGQPAQAGASLLPGQRLNTDAASSAVLQMGDGSEVKLMPNSEVALGEHRRYAIQAASPAEAGAPEGLLAGTLRLLRGSLDLLASKVLRAKPLEVTTPTAVIGVRGTDYRVHHAAEGQTATRTEVLSGRVHAQASDGSRLLASAEVPAGQGAILQPGQASPRVLALPAAPSLAGVPSRFERPLVRFQVAGETGALRVQVAPDAAFNQVLRDETFAAGAEVRLAGLPDGDWHLRARRVDANGLAGADTATRFTLKARPEPPAGMAPRPRAKAAVGAVPFQWAENTEAARYHLEVARDAAFQDKVHDAPALTGQRGEVTLATPGVYHWRLASVRADGDQGPWGDPQSFELRPLPTPPSGGLSDDGLSLQLAWAGRPEDRQQVELSHDPQFSSVVRSAELNESRWVLPVPDAAGTYYFRYRSVEPDGFVTPWSTTLKLDMPRDWRFLWYFAPFLLGL